MKKIFINLVSFLLFFMLTGQLFSQIKLNSNEIPILLLSEVNTNYPTAKELDWYKSEKGEIYVVIDGALTYHFKNSTYNSSKNVSNAMEVPISIIECMNKRYPTKKLYQIKNSSNGTNVSFQFIYKEGEDYSVIIVDDNCIEI